MSLPAFTSSMATGAIVALNPIDSFLQMFNTNPYFIGIMMLILNLGGRFISMDVTKKQEQFFQHPWIRRILIFTVLFVATRNIWVAFWLSFFVILFLGYLFNENSALCIFGQGGASGSKCSSNSVNGGNEDLTPEEKEILRRLSEKQARFGQNSSQKKLENIKNSEEIDDVSMTEIYSANMYLLKK
jgi:hypothetical protein